MLKLNILNRHGIEFSYVLLLDDYWDCRADTREQYETWVNSKPWRDIDKFTAICKIGFALDIHWPNHFYEFTKE